MALDEPRESDRLFVLHGLTYLIDASLLQQAAPVRVDFLEDEHGAGFAISSRLSGQGVCGGSCSC